MDFNIIGSQAPSNPKHFTQYSLAENGVVTLKWSPKRGKQASLLFRYTFDFFFSISGIRSDFLTLVDVDGITERIPVEETVSTTALVTSKQMIKY